MSSDEPRCGFRELGVRLYSRECTELRRANSEKTYRDAFAGAKAHSHEHNKIDPGTIVIAALDDAALGIVFLIAPAWVFRVADVTPPNHWAYVQFPGVLLVIFGLMFAAIAARPTENRNLIPMGSC